MTQEEVSLRMRGLRDEIDIIREHGDRGMADDERVALDRLYAHHSALYAIGVSADAVRSALRECGVYESGEVQQ